MDLAPHLLLHSNELLFFKRLNGEKLVILFCFFINCQWLMSGEACLCIFLVEIDCNSHFIPSCAIRASNRQWCSALSFSIVFLSFTNISLFSVSFSSSYMGIPRAERGLCPAPAHPSLEIVAYLLPADRLSFDSIWLLQLKEHSLPLYTQHKKERPLCSKTLLWS